MPNIFIIEWNRAGLPYNVHNKNSFDLSVNLQYLTKLSGIDYHLGRELDNLHRELLYNDCKNE